MLSAHGHLAETKIHLQDTLDFYVPATTFPPISGTTSTNVPKKWVPQYRFIMRLGKNSSKKDSSRHESFQHDYSTINTQWKPQSILDTDRFVTIYMLIIGIACCILLLYLKPK